MHLVELGVFWSGEEKERKDGETQGRERETDIEREGERLRHSLQHTHTHS